MKPKILHLITSLNIGGTERNLLTILQFLKEKYDFSVVYLKERGKIAEEIEKLGIPLFKFNFFSLYKYLRKNEINILHTHLYRANILGRIVGKIVRPRQIIISSQRAIDAWKKFYHVWLDSFTAQFCDLIIANSLATKNLLCQRERISAEKIVVVYK
ncbi:MAG TPA: hypothetical protein DHV62_01105, partial [Elusimicrobia bacterium]|nr:hypothetical protein [Elusimicrobiota bacterium]